MTEPSDYDFSNGFEQPVVDSDVPQTEVPITPGPDMTDIEANRAIIGASVLAIRNNPLLAEPAPDHREALPSTYSHDEFAKDSDATEAGSAFRSAWLELYLHQVRSGDYPRLTEIRRAKNSTLHLLPRQLTEQLPDGSSAEEIEIFLTPWLYEEYLKSGLLSTKLGGRDGIPRIYWIRQDGPMNYIAGTNATEIYRTKDMNIIDSATRIGTSNSVALALASIPNRPGIGQAHSQTRVTNPWPEQQNRYRRQSHGLIGPVS